MAEIFAENNATKIRGLGVNIPGQEADNPLIITNCVIPWLQDTAAQDVWGKWDGVQRVVQILNTFNMRAATFDLNLKPLGAPPNANWTELKTLLKTVAGE